MKYCALYVLHMKGQIIAILLYREQHPVINLRDFGKQEILLTCAATQMKEQLI